MYILLDSTFIESITSSVIASGLFMVLFTAFSAWIAILIKRRLKRRKKKNRPQKPPCKVLSNFSPLNRDEIIGRQNDLASIALKLENTDTILLLNGMGGIGKTTLATLYTQTHKDEYNNLVWINAAQGIQKGFVSDTTLTHHLGLTEALQQLQEQQPDNFEKQGSELLLNALLDKPNGLLIIDNEQQEQGVVDDVRKKLQGSGNWKILITAREILTGVEPYKVDELNIDDARKLFYQYYTKEQNDALVDEINELLLRHTLMVELMARVAQNRDSFDLVLLKNDLETTKLNFAKDDKVESNHWGTGDTKTQRLNAFLQAAFTIAEFEIQENDSEEQKAEKQHLRQLLMYWCLMPERQPLRLDLFCELCKITDEEKKETNTWFNQLVKTGWLHKDNERYLMHPVVQQALCWQLKPKPNDVDNLVGCLNTDINRHFNIKHTLIGVRELEPYIKSILNYFLKFTKEVYNENWWNIYSLTNNFGLYKRQIGENNASLKYHLSSLNIINIISTKDDISLCNAYGNISIAYGSLGDNLNALKYCLKDLELRKKILDKKHPLIGNTYNNLSIIYKDLGVLDKALNHGKQSLDNRIENFGNKHPSTASTLNNISLIYSKNNNFKEAKKFALKAFKIRKSVLDENHPDIAQSLHTLAIIEQNLLDFKSAKLNINQAISIYGYCFPNGHPSLDEAKRRQKIIDEKLKRN